MAHGAGMAEPKALSASKADRCVKVLRLAAATAVKEGLAAPEAITEIGAVLTVDAAGDAGPRDGGPAAGALTRLTAATPGWR